MDISPKVQNSILPSPSRKGVSHKFDSKKMEFGQKIKIVFSKIFASQVTLNIDPSKFKRGNYKHLWEKIMDS